MRLVAAFLSLVRWSNLAFIAITQLLFYYCLYLPLYLQQDVKKLVLLIVASVFIAAAGYIINDYFDLNIDNINKPGKNVFSDIVHRRWAIVWHFAFSFLGIMATIVAVGIDKWYLITANIFCILLLWLYSTSFKKQLLVGNFVISLLSAWTVLLLFFAFTDVEKAFMADAVSIKFFRVAFLYAAFAFVISIIREAIKDMEDIEGDARYGCATLPIVAGIKTTKIYTTVWIVVLAASLIVLQLYMLQLGWWPAVLYCVLFVILPLILLQSHLAKAHSQQHFASASSLSKWIMFAGILSMLFFKIYF
jgi:4-hydroxybenzoate polyprenyltransferase